MTAGRLSRDGSALTVHIPMALRKRARKMVIAPNGTTGWAPPRARIDNTLVKALARAWRWRKLLEAGRYTSVEELAAAERINPSYVSRILRLGLLAPDIVEAILDGRQPCTLQLTDLMDDIPVEWQRQLERFGLMPPPAPSP